MTIGAARRHERIRLAVGVAAGVVAAAATAALEPWQLAALVGWDVVAVVHAAWTWARIGRLDGAATERHANREDDSRETTRLLLSVAALASLVGVATALVKAKHATGSVAVALTVTAVFTVIASWALVHTLFTLRYADLYYYGSQGGIDFKSDAQPDYHDFAYVSFTVGMTFQTSDTDIRDGTIRRTVLKQALLSYVFGTVIIAVTINVIAGLVR